MTKKVEEFDRRHGPGIKWQMSSRSGTEVISGFSIDNLDTKTLDETINLFEKLFVSIRMTLEEHESFCLDAEHERLEICQKLSKKLEKSLKGGSFNDVW